MIPFPKRQEPPAGKPVQLRGLAGNFDSDCFPMTIQKPTTLQEAKSIARHLRLTLRKVRSGALSRELPRWKRNHGLLHGQS